MREYEAVFIFQAEEEPFTEGRNFVKGELEKAGIKILKEEDMGNRALSYAIKKKNQGRYFLYELQAQPDQINSIDRSLKLRTEILKYLVVLKEGRQ
jgi:small subunit ribosomal protein S6